MSQQMFSQYVSLARIGPDTQDTIPVVAAIAQTRDGKDELLHGTVSFVPGPGGLYVPVSASNRLPVEATLTGRTVKVLKAHHDIPYNYDDILNTGTSFKYLWLTENIGGSGSNSIPVDCSEYPHVDIVVRNNTDAPLWVEIVIVPSELREVETGYSTPSQFRNIIVDDYPLDPESVKWFRSIEMPNLNRVYAVRTALISKQSKPTTGTISVVYIGSKI